MILMAIENLYNKCDLRKDPGALRYQTQVAEDCKNYDNVPKRSKHAEVQLGHIKQYLKDFARIIEDWRREPK